MLVYKDACLKPALQKIFEARILQKLMSIFMCDPTHASSGAELVVSLQIRHYSVSFTDSMEQEPG